MNKTAQSEIQKLELEIFELSEKLNKLRKEAPPTEVPNYTFQTLTGETTLLELFANKKQLFVIHNMGQGCRYCTLWADGLNGFLPHLESEFAVVLVSKDAPELQRAFANSRGWRYRLASHGGGKYIQEQTVQDSQSNAPGIVLYERNGEQIAKKNFSAFGPGDQFCSVWNILSLAGRGENDWTPQFNYWQRPAVMDDGGQNLK